MGKDFLALLKKIRRWFKTSQDILQSCIERLLRNVKFSRYVFMFHVVSDNKENWYDENYSVSMKSFSIFIDAVQQAGYEIVTTKKFLERNRRKRVLLTFDDAFACIYEEVFPFLRERNIPFIVFQSWNLLGGKNYLDQKMINEMLRFNEFELGAHGISHEHLADMSARLSFKEIKESKKNLEKIFHVKISGMAYPYGAKSDVKLRDMHYAKKTGYHFAFGTVSTGIFSRLVNRFYLPRINVNQENYRRIIDRCIS